jgi:Uma2 family endonuclease
VSKSRLAALHFQPKSQEFFPGAPDLAIEILSPSNTRAEIDERLRDFFSSGSKLAWVIDPRTESVEVCRSLTERKLLGSGAFLEGQEIVLGFNYAIADLFREVDWDTN